MLVAEEKWGRRRYLVPAFFLLLKVKNSVRDFMVYIFVYIFEEIHCQTRGSGNMIL